MEDGIDCGGPVTGGGVVPEESKFESAAAKESPGFERGREGKTATGDSYPTGGAIRARTVEVCLGALKNLKYVIGVIGDDTEGVPGLNAAKIELGLPGASDYEGLTIRYHISGFSAN
jgi:hypothetical protein